jgi:biotin carboxyl carrier protein
MNEEGETTIYLTVDHHNRRYIMAAEQKAGVAAAQSEIGKEEIEELAAVGDVRAPFMANVCEIAVEVGQEVAEGDKLVVVEAMKMQTPVLARIGGVVESVTTKVGDAVKPGAKLVKLKTGSEEKEGK